MTADQLVVALFVDHWLMTTFVAPWLTFLYAFVTKQVWWAFWSAVLAAIYHAEKK